MGDKGSKKPGIIKRFCQRICMPLHRALSSYLEIAPDALARDETEWTHDSTANYQYENTVNYDQPMYLNYADSESTRQSRSRYRTPRPVHPSSRSSSRQSPSVDYTQSFATSGRSSEDIDQNTREETQSSDYAAPRVNGHMRMRLKNGKNKDLPRSLCAEPAQVTHANLADIELRNSNTSLVDQIPKASSSSREAAWCLWNPKNNRSRRSSGESSRQATQSQRSSRESKRQVSQPQPSSQSQSSRITARNPYSSKLTEAICPSSQTCSAYCLVGKHPVPDERERRSTIMPTNIQLLRDDSERVLCKSHSRGYMVVRRILSLEALRETAKLRTHGSLVGMMEELTHAAQELSELTAAMKAEARRVPVAHRTHESSGSVCDSDANDKMPPEYSVD